MGKTRQGYLYKRVSLWGMVFLVGCLLIGLQMASANNTNYYVDCSAVSNGTGTIGSPWNTFTSVNSHAAFQPGDQILLKKGTTCNGQLNPPGSGSSGSPITIDAYGSGAAPIINGGGTAVNTGAVYLLNQQYWVIQNLEVTNISTDLTKYRAGIMVFLNGFGGTANSITIQNNYVHDVDSKLDAHVTGGIVVRSFLTTGVDSYNNVVIQNNTVSNVGRVGITFWDGTWASAGQGSTNVKVQNNVVSQTEGDNIVVVGTDGALIEHNTGSNGGTSSSVAYAVGIWFTRAYNTTMQYNEAYQMQANSGTDDSEGFDVDVSSVNGVVQYNYSHDNAGGGYLVCGGSEAVASVDTDNITIRYNISQNDGFHGVLTFSCAKMATNMKVYNNTFYLGSGTTAPVINYYQSFSNPNQSWSFKNNIVYQLGSGGYALPGTGGVFDYNVFYGNHPGSEPSDAHKLTSDPLLVAAGTGGTGRNTVDGYKLRAGSPALGSGVLISGNGGLDYWGNAVSSSTAPNRGAYNGAGTTSELLFNTGFELPQWEVTAGVMTQDSSTSHGGGKSMKVSSRTQVYEAVRQNVMDALIANGQGTYNLSAWAKFATGSDIATVMLILNDSAGSHGYTGTWGSVGSGSFAQLTNSANVTWTGTLTRAIVYVQTGSSLNDIYVDDFNVTKGASPNLVSNPDMEKVQWAALASTLTPQMTDIHSGSYGVKISGRTNVYSSAAFDIKDILTASGTGTYDFSAWAKLAAGSDTAFVIINLNDSTGNHLFSGTATSIGTAGFTKLTSSQNVTWTGALTSARLYVQTTSSTNDLYVDDYSLIKQ